jgi:peroxiredoxin
MWMNYRRGLPVKLLNSLLILALVAVNLFAKPEFEKTVMLLSVSDTDSTIALSALKFAGSGNVQVSVEDIQQVFPLTLIRPPRLPMLVLATSVNCVSVPKMTFKDYQTIGGDYQTAGQLYVRVDSLASALGCRYIPKKKSAGRLECEAFGSLRPVGNEVGDYAPGFQLGNSDGAVVTSEALLDSGGLVVAFIRSADWEPFSRDLLTRLDANQKNFAKEDVRLVVIHGYDQSVAKEWQDTLKTTVPLLTDNLSATMIAYGVYRQPRLPQPTLFVLDSDGMIRWKHKYGEEREPPEMVPVLEAVRGLKEKGERIKDKSGSSEGH